MIPDLALLLKEEIIATDTERKDSGYPKNQKSKCFLIINFTSSGAGLSEKLYRSLSSIKLSRVLADNEVKVFNQKTTH